MLKMSQTSYDSIFPYGRVALWAVVQVYANITDETVLCCHRAVLLKVG